MPQDGRISPAHRRQAPSTCGSRPCRRRTVNAPCCACSTRPRARFTLEGLGMDGRSARRTFSQPDPAAAWHRARDRAYRLGQDDHAVRRRWAAVDTATTNVLTVEDPVEYELRRHRPDPGECQDRSHLRQGPARHPAPGPGRDHDRRDPRLRDGADRDPGLADRSPRAGHASTPMTRHPAVTRLIDMGVEPYPAVLVSLLGVPWPSASCASCARTAAASDAEGRWHPVGCPTCVNSGYKGRTGVYELMVADDKVRAQVHSRASEADMARTAREIGMKSMREDGDRLVTGRHHLAGRTPAGHAGLRTQQLHARLPFRSAGRQWQADRRPRRGRERQGRPGATALAAAGAAGRSSRSVPRSRPKPRAAPASRGGSSTAPRWRSGRASSPGWSGSGLPLERALTALSDEAEDPRQRELVAHLRSEVNAGNAFAKALSTSPREFDDVYRAVVAAGETSGHLGIVLEKLADDLEERQALESQADRRLALPGHRVAGGHRHRDLPGHLRRAAGRQRVQPTASVRCPSSPWPCWP